MHRVNSVTHSSDNKHNNNNHHNNNNNHNNNNHHNNNYNNNNHHYNIQQQQQPSCPHGFVSVQPRFNPENHVVPVPVDLQRPPKVVRSHSESIPRPCSLSPWRPGCQNPLRNSEDGPLAIYPRRRYMHDISPASDWSLTGYDNLDEFNNTLLSWPWLVLLVGGVSRHRPPIGCSFSLIGPSRDEPLLWLVSIDRFDCWLVGL